MAGNFWQSSHFQQWLLDKQDLIRERQYDLGILTEEEYQKIFIFFANFIQVLGEQLKLRQQVIATATVYLKRFYARNSLGCIDPLLLAPTCVFLASKVEEFGVISNSRLITTCQTVVKNKLNYAYSQEFPYRTNHVLECEFYLLENLDCCLIVYQPYRPLLQLLHDVVYAHSASNTTSPGSGGAGAGGGSGSGTTPSSGSGSGGHPSPHHHHQHHAHSGGPGATPPSHPSAHPHSSHPSAPNSGAVSGSGGSHQGHGGGGSSLGNPHGEEQLLALAWRVANDSLRTDLCLLYPPYQIALGCLQIACVIMQRDLKSWFAELNVDMDKIQEICRCLVSLFELWKSYDEKKDIMNLLKKMPKPKSQPTSQSYKGKGD